MATPYELLAAQIGHGEADAAIQDYLKTGGQNLDPRVTAWCAAAVNASLAQGGQQGTGSNMARSFLNWGQGVDTPQKGDLAVFQRGDANGPYGHVGFFDGYNEDGSIRVLGGNQKDGVNISSYSPDKLLGFRRGEGGTPQPQNAMQPGPQMPGQPTQNAMAQRPQMQWDAGLQDASAFMRPLNALAPNLGRV